MQFQLLALPMVGGVDTRTDPRSVQPPKLITCSNARFTTPGKLAKRNGYQNVLPKTNTDGASTTVPGIRLLNTGSSLWLADTGGRFYPRDDGRWGITGSSYVGSGFMVGYPTVNPTLGVFSIRATDQVTAFGYTFCASETFYTSSQIRVHAYNATTGQQLYLDLSSAFSSAVTGEVLLVNSAMSPQLVAVGNAVYCFYLNSSGTTLSVAVFTQSALNAKSTWVTSTIASDVNNTTPVYDVCVSGGRILLVYNTSTANTLKFGYVDPSGALDGALTTQGTTAAPEAVTCCVDNSNRDFALFWTRSGVVEGISYSDAKVAKGAVSSVNSTAGAHTNITSLALDGIAYVWWENSAAATYNRSVSASALAISTSTASGTVNTLTSAALASHPWISNTTDINILVTYDSTLQPTYFVYKLQASQGGMGSVVARIFPGTAGGVTFRPTLPRFDSTGSGFTLRVKTQLVPAVRTSATSQFSGQRARRITLSESDSGLFQSVVVNGVAYTNGAVMFQLDGASCVENNFNLFPENITTSTSNGGGSIAAGTYSYRVYPEWINSLGQREQGTMAASLSVTVVAPNNTVQITVPTLSHTMKTGKLYWAIYRTTAAGTVYYRVSSGDPSVSASNNGYYQNGSGPFLDLLADASITGNELDYQSSDGELDHVAPPPCSVICYGNNRVFISGMEDPNVIWASKIITTGKALAFNDALTISAPPGDGPITALSIFNDELIIFRKSAIYSVGGDGPDNTGSTGQFNTPRIISNVIGCTNPRSLVLTSLGLFFQSQKGIYLLGYDRSITYIGADVEAYNGETITAATAIPNSSEIRFLTANRCLVYDTLAQQWSVWSISGTDATIYNGTYMYLAGTGDLRQEVSGYFLDIDKPYQMQIETPWIHPGGLQGYQRVKRVLFLGDFKSNHKARVRLAYDYEAWTDWAEWDPVGLVKSAKLNSNQKLGYYAYQNPAGQLQGNVKASPSQIPATGVYQFQVFVPNQKCSAIKVYIEDVSEDGTAPLEAYSLAEIAFELGLKTGPSHLPAVKRQG